MTVEPEEVAELFDRRILYMIEEEEMLKEINERLIRMEKNLKDNIEKRQNGNSRECESVR